MAETAIEWTHRRMPDGTVIAGYTFNPWIGCTAVSPACDLCYAKTLVENPKFGGGNDFSVRRRTKPANWNKVRSWNRKAAKLPVHPAVFCASLADWADNKVPIEWHVDLLDLIRTTPDLDWMLLTKRPQNIEKILRKARDWCMANNADDLGRWIDRWINGRQPPANVWLGTTVENQEEAERRIPVLLRVPAVRYFLSMEPLLEAVNLRRLRMPELAPGFEHYLDGLTGYWSVGRSMEGAFVGVDLKDALPLPDPLPGVDLVLVGGESGGKEARPMHPDWARSLREQCSVIADFHFKQWGNWAPAAPVPGGDFGGDIRRGVVRHLYGAGRVPDGHFRKGDVYMRNVGKKAAGRLLDGRTWDGMPASEPRAA